MRKQPALWTFVFWPLVFLTVCWAIWYYDFSEGILHKPGVQPRKLVGLVGIFTSPLFHGDLEHLISNSLPILVLGTGLFYFYRTLHKSTIVWLWIGSGLLLWCFGREGNHIGASGLVYALFSFILLGGIISKNKHLLAISLLSIFIYGSLWWGTLPVDPKVSWDGHLSSLIWGGVLAFLNRNALPKAVEIQLSDDDSYNEALYGPNYWKKEEQVVSDGKEAQQTKVRYFYIPSENRIVKKTEEEDSKQ